MKKILRVLMSGVAMGSLCGCETPSASHFEMDSNYRYFLSNDDGLTVGSMFAARLSKVIVGRIHELRWTPDISVGELSRQWRRPTYMRINVEFSNREDISNKVAPSLHISELSSSYQKSYRDNWRQRVIAAFQDSTFQCDSAALSQALDRDGATVHYCLVARHDSAQMGHVDVIKLIVTDTSGRIVAMTKPQYSMDYPCRFIDGTTWKYDFLF